jgi:hypothetical protein
VFRVGDRVWCSVYGWGEVAEIVDYGFYPVYCDFRNSSAKFSKCGCLSPNSPRALFFDEVVPQESALHKISEVW